MKLTSAAVYGIRALAYMTAQKHNRPIASHHMAQAQGIPAFFVLKVLKRSSPPAFSSPSRALAAATG
jgi:DNA-binding IscR family transcriptional regulator